MKDVKPSLIIGLTFGMGLSRVDDDIGRWSKLEIDTGEGRDFANRPGEDFSEFRREAGRSGVVAAPIGPV